MIDTLSCQSEADLTEKFFEKLLIGAIDKTVDHDDIPSVWSGTQETSRPSQAHHSLVMAHRPANNVNSNNSNTAWPVHEKRDVY